MKPIKRRAAQAVALWLAVALLATGCGDGALMLNPVKKQEDDRPEPVVFTVFSADPSHTWNNMQDDIGRYITETTGVKLEQQFADDNPEEKIKLIVASGRYPDFISPKGTTAPLVDAGAMLDLTELIEQHAPNIKRVLGDQFNRLRYSADDPAIYFIPTLHTVGHRYFEAGGPFNLQHAVVKELGYPTIRTLDDYEQAIRAYMEKYPLIDGQPTIGLSLLADDWRMLISTTNPAFYATGGSDNGEYYIDPDTYEAIVHYKRPEEREYFRWLNHMHNSGLLDKESFVQKYDQYRAKIASGRVLATIDQDWSFAEAENILRASGKPERMYGHYPVTLDETFKAANYQSDGFNAGWGVGITIDCNDPVRAIQFLDYLASEEGQVLIQWGIEGQHYNMVGGKRVMPDDIQERRANDNNTFRTETGIGQYFMSVRYGDGVLDSTGNYYTTNYPEQISSTRSNIENEVLRGYGIEFWKDLYPHEDEFPVKPWGAAWNIVVPGNSPINFTFQKFQDIMRKRIPEAILADPEQFDLIYDTMLREFEQIGISDMEAEFTRLVKKRVELWQQ